MRHSESIFMTATVLAYMKNHAMLFCHCARLQFASCMVVWDNLGRWVRTSVICKLRTLVISQRTVPIYHTAVSVWLQEL